MKIIITFTLLTSIIFQNAWAQSCPLNNAKLTDLRTAASKLAKNITLSAECKSYEDTVNNANTELSNIATQIHNYDVKQAESDGSSIEGSGINAKATALAAVSQLNTVSNLFRDNRCGGEVMGFLDYASTFVDVALGMAPFLALYGGSEAMPWVLGGSLGGAAAKALLSFFKNKNINMRNPDQSNNFIKNSCAFHNLNIIKNSLDDLQMHQTPTIETNLSESIARLEALREQKPNDPDVLVLKQFKFAETDKAKIKFLKDQMAADPIEGCSYVRSFANRNDEDNNGTLVNRIWTNYAGSIKENKYRVDLERNYFLSELNISVASVSELNSGDIAKCNRWMAKVTTMSEAGFTYLTKQVNENKELKEYHAYNQSLATLEESIKLQEARIKFFNELTGKGFNIEYSEIIRSHQQVQDALFESSKWLSLIRMKGLAEVWLKVKYEDARDGMQDFKDRKSEVEDRIVKVEKILGGRFERGNIEAFALQHENATGKRHPVVTSGLIVDVCNQLKRTWSSWYNGLVHSRAGRDYCRTFDSVINKIDYPQVQTLCFGTTNSKGKKLSSFRNQVSDFMVRKAEADAIAQQIENLSCKESAELTAELIALPLN